MPYNFIPEDQELFRFKCNQHVLVQKPFIKFVRGFSHVTDDKYIPPDLLEPYPLVNSYYEFAEDYDAVNRLPHLLYEKYQKESLEEPSTSSTSDDKISIESASAPLPPRQTQRQDHFIERKAQIAYLETKPKCFVILGKPGLGEERLGKLLADYWRCVFINPETLIQDEIRSGSRAGLCIEFNLRCGRSISVDVIIRLLQKRLSSEGVKHRGFVLCGFPLIANDLFTDDPVSSESAIFNVHEIFESLIDNVVPKDTVKHVSRTSVNLDVDESDDKIPEIVDHSRKSSTNKKLVFLQEDVIVLPVIEDVESKICYPSKEYDKNMNQMEFIMSLCEEHDYCIVYLKCSNEEVVNIRQDNRYDSQTTQQMSIQRERSDNIYYTLYNLNANEEEFAFFDDNTGINRRMVRFQHDFQAQVRKQLEDYLHETQLVIEKYILLKDPQNVIRLDGRMSPHKLFQVLRMRLKVLPFAPAILPKLLVTPNVDFDEPGEHNSPRNPPSALALDEIATDETYLSMRRRKALGPLYTWNLSDWKYSCPVAMKEGLQEDGNGKYAVHFMNNIFFLSNEARCEQFLENPRPFLLPPMPITIRRVFIVGPPNSGKTAIAKCIQHFNGAAIIDFRSLKNKCAHRKLSVSLGITRENMLQESLNYMKMQRKKTYYQQEAERLKKVNAYLDCIIKNLEDLLESLRMINEFANVEFSPFPALSERETPPALARAESVIDKLGDFRELLGIETPEDCEKFLHDRDLLMNYLPTELLEPTVYTFDVVGPSSSCVIEYANKLLVAAEAELIKGMETDEAYAECINSVLDDYRRMLLQGKISAWIVDGFPASGEVLKLVSPENVADMTYIMDDSASGEALLNMNLRGTQISDDSVTALLQQADLSKTRFITNMDINEFPLMSSEKNSADIEAMINNYLVECLPHLIEILKEFDYKYQTVNVAGKTFKEALAGLIEDYTTISNQKVRIVTDEEKRLEMSYYGDYGDVESGEFEGEGGGFEDKLATEKAFRENRRLGNTSYYDPVAFATDGILWRGKEDYLVNYLNKMWMFATDANMKMFMETPQRYSRHFAVSKYKLPPPRVCIVGGSKIGKTTQARLLCKRLGLYYFNFDDELKKVQERRASESVEDDSTLREIVLAFCNDPNKKAIGYVMDGFPRWASDAKFMIENSVIPDCIVELTMSPDELVQRFLSVLLDEWHAQISAEKETERQKYEKEIELWQKRINLEKIKLLEERREERYAKKFYGEDYAQSESGSLLSIKSYQEAQEEKQIDELLQKQFPPPTLTENWETEEAATERLRQAAKSSTKFDPSVLIPLQEIFDQEKIPWYTLNALQDKNKVYNLIMQHIMEFLYRGQSFFERAYDISIEMAEKLLEHGYYFLSRFGKTCPVQMHEKYNPLQMYISKETQFQLFPMIYSNYIYFLAGAENREKFKKDILKYTQQDYVPLPLLRARIAVIGPPHSGKTTVAERMSLDYSFEHISIGKAVRRVLKYMPSSILAQRVKLYLEQGDELSDDLTMHCVEAMTFEAKAVALGYVMDGLPNSIEETKLLAQMNLIPYLIVDLSTDLDYIFKYMDIFTPPHKPEYSKMFLKCRFADWAIDQDVVRDWLDKEYQNVAAVSVVPSRWKTWSSVREILLAVMNEIKHYYRNSGKDMVLRVANMLVTPYEFICRQSEFKNYCPLCLFYTNSLTGGGNPPDRTGLTSYHDKFYWLCTDHIDEFEDDPDKFLGSNVRHSLPVELPKVITLTKMPDNAFLYGYCVVCAALGYPDKIYNKGKFGSAVQLGQQVYMFDEDKCMHKFIKNPEICADIANEVSTGCNPPCDIQSLPTLGMLEQYTANQIIKALIEIEKVRPLIPGLSIAQSAAVCLGLILKINNPNTSEKYLQLYIDAKKKSMDNQEDLKRTIKEAKQTLNPYLHYQEPLPPFEFDLKRISDETTDLVYIKDIIDNMLDRIEYDERVERTVDRLSYHPMFGARRVPVPDARFDYLCQYHKPASKVPGFLNVVDIAGLVKGASEGQGLGNAFLSHISACDAIFHLCRAFEDDDVTHVEGEVNPIRDLEIIGEELRLKDEEMMLKKLEGLKRTVLNDKKLKPEYDALVKIKGVLVDDKQHIRFHDWSTTDIEVLNKYLFLTSKPAIYLVNLSEKDYIKKKNKWLLKIKEWVDKNDPGALIIPFSGAFEAKLVELDEAEAKQYIEDNKATSALEKIIVQGYKALNLEYFFTAGPDEVKAWTIQKGTKAPQAAGRIHTDFEKGFIMAEVMKFTDFKEEGSEAAAKAAGKYRQQGRNYMVEDGDIIFFKFNAGAGLKDAKKK